MLLKCALLALLAIHLSLVPVEARGNREVLQRQKREWISAPRKLKENHDYSGLESIARIRSDQENFTRIVYSLRGPGVNEPPVGVFGVDSKTGYVKIYSVLDREYIEYYHLIGSAKYEDGRPAEKDIDLKITVLDENDNPPVIRVNQVGSVHESSRAGTVVMRVNVTDADKENTINSKIYYSIEGSSAAFFQINSQTGEIMVRQSTLDRETQDTYKVMVRAADLNGQSGGNTVTGEVVIKLLDINDNVPYLEKESYEGKVEENTVNMEVMRIQALDKDLIHTDNWLAVYRIVSGNEGGYFTITTDKETNEGVITITKALDYEEIKELNLGIVVANKAAYSHTISGSTTSKTYPVKINVVNQKEGPRFQPSVKVVTISEDSSSVSINKVITTYTAIDSDTQQTATNVIYAKYRDEDNWLIVDKNTAEIKLNKMPDRESTFLINGTYYAEIICITQDSTSKTATGTIAIQVEDFNDHCPQLTATTKTMCFEDNVVFVTAVDGDDFPNSAPFDFQVIPDGSTGKWTVEHYNDTTAILRDQASLWPGIYKVQLLVKDQQGKSCTDLQVMDVVVCTCHETTKTCLARNRKTSEFGAPGILLMLLGFLLLLLLPLLLLFCLCGATSGDFKPIPIDTKQHLISYHTESQGEDKEVPLLHGNVGKITTKNVDTLHAGGMVDTSRWGAAGHADGRYSHNVDMETMERTGHYYKSGFTENLDYMDGGVMTWQHSSGYSGGVFDGMALSRDFLGSYYLSKSEHASQQTQLTDNLEIFDYEGEGSLAGSVGCCSLLDPDDNLDFLNDLGPKFKTLAQICQGSTIVTESVKTKVSVPPPRPVSPVKPPSSHTHVHTHTETHTNRDRINTSGLSTSTLSRVQVQDNVVIPSQTVLVQQPAMYYAATPMYVVESNPQMMLVTGGAQQAVGQVAQVGLSQGLVQVGGIPSSQGVVLVDRQAGMSGVVGQGSHGRSHGTKSRQVLVVENGSSTGGRHVERGYIETGSLQPGHTLQGRTVSRSSRGTLGSAGSHEDFTASAAPRAQASQRVVVQHKKVSVTERADSSSRA
ncbi:desmoglein-2-like protein [Synchiropus splendidus]|uniref:desmoglein-2-like protein n=1 Tax=Synchiropus splendidus TaxID=270530 RepID=UPI00237DF5AB|nr:desmoglein-2-like protein [Synchiropus splendidus]XP_053738389.1 desmoglein-2-like protein [Synchiropus splendidus]